MKRRLFLQSTSAALGAASLFPNRSFGEAKSPNEKLNIAGIGVGGQGGGVLSGMADENIVALCDVDWNKAAGTFNKFDKATKYHDYRIMLEKESGIDAVMIATPDHMHAPIAMAALRAGKHVYVEKPMAHSIEEARVMTAMAKKSGLVTQMGNNGHAGEGLRLTREWLQAGAIGPVTEIHCWSDRPGQWWKQGLDRPTISQPVPSGLDWDLWLGAAPDRPYHDGYHPFAWRGWIDFGTGALGDMAIHNMDPAFYALDLGAPVATQCETSPITSDSYPVWNIVTYEFAAKGSQPAVTIHWYDGGKMPPKPDDLDESTQLADNGIYFVGSEGTMVCGGWSGAPTLYPESRREEFKIPDPTIPRSIGHIPEWIQACKDNDPGAAKAGFEYSGPFTESLLVGNLSVLLQKRIQWDAEAMKATNAPEADAIIRKAHRKGFGI